MKDVKIRAPNETVLREIASLLSNANIPLSISYKRLFIEAKEVSSAQIAKIKALGGKITANDKQDLE